MATPTNRLVSVSCSGGPPSCPWMFCSSFLSLCCREHSEKAAAATAAALWSSWFGFERCGRRSAMKDAVSSFLLGREERWKPSEGGGSGPNRQNAACQEAEAVSPPILT